MKNLPAEVSDEDVEEMWNYADKNGDGRLSYKEFKVKYLQCSPSSSPYNEQMYPIIVYLPC